MNLRRAVVGVALAAIALTATGVPAASAAERPSAERPSHSGRPGPAPHPAPASGTAPVPASDTAARPEPGPGTPRLGSAPLKGLPTLQQARERGLIPASAGPLSLKGATAKGATAGGVSALSWPAPRCGTPPQGSGYHDYLAPGECLTEGTYIAAHYGMSGIDNLWYELWMQNGNLILYSHRSLGGYEVLWHTNTSGWGVSAWMQHDGNFVLYDRNGDPMWALGTNGCGGQGAWLRVQADANLVLYTRDWKPVWARFDGPSARPC